MKEQIRMRQLTNNVEYIIGGYLNGMYDFPEDYPQLSEERVINYVYAELFDIKDDGNGTTYMHKGVCDDLKFLGTETIVNEILKVADENGVLAK